MPSPIDFLPGEGRLVNIVKGLLETTTKLEDIKAEISKMGLKGTEETISNIFDYFTGPVAAAQEHLASLSLESFPNLDVIPKALGFQKRNFAYNVVVRGVNEVSGDKVEQFVTISSNSLLTLDQAIQSAEDIVNTNQSKYAVAGGTGSLQDVFQNNEGIINPELNAFQGQPFKYGAGPGAEFGAFPGF